MPNIRFEPPGDDFVVFLYDARWDSRNQDGVVHALARTSKGPMKVIVPFFPQGTMELVNVKGA